MDDPKNIAASEKPGFIPTPEVATPWIFVDVSTEEHKLKLANNETPPIVATEMVRYDKFVSGLFKYDTNEMLMKVHAALGIVGEAGELVDAVKKQWVYNRPEDLPNIIEELGDMRFYMQAIMNLYHISENQVLQGNANKLAIRYKGLIYSDQAAQERADKKPGA